jgi:hypothetical protein
MPVLFGLVLCTILLSSCLLSKNAQMKIYTTIILVDVCGCETWCVTLKGHLL